MERSAQLSFLDFTRRHAGGVALPAIFLFATGCTPVQQRPSDSGAPLLAPLPSSAHQAAPPAAVPAAKKYGALLWLRGDRGAVTTAWLGADGATLAASTLPVIATEHGLGVLRLTAQEWKRCPCPPGSSSPEDPSTAVALTLESLGAKPVELVPPHSKDPECDSQTASTESHVELLGVVGSVVLYMESETGMGCVAAHPYFGSSVTAYDANTKTQLDLRPPAEALAALTTAAKRALLANHADCLMDADESPKYFSTTFRYTAESKLHARYTFTMSAPYVCGTGPDHYSVTTELDSATLPLPIQRFARAPSWLAPKLREKGAALLGVSELPPSLVTDETLAQFRTLH